MYIRWIHQSQALVLTEMHLSVLAKARHANVSVRSVMVLMILGLTGLRLMDPSNVLTMCLATHLLVHTSTASVLHILKQENAPLFTLAVQMTTHLRQKLVL